MPTSSSSIKWIHYIESNWVPPNFIGGTKTRSRWALAIDTNVLSRKTLQGFEVNVLPDTGLSYWPKFNACDYLWNDDTPRIISPLQVAPHKHITLDTNEGSVNCSTDLDLEDVDEIDQFPIVVVHTQNEWRASVLDDYQIQKLSWRIWNYGTWSVLPITVSENMVLTIPFGELVYLEFEGVRNNHFVLGRLHVVGRPGIASGRSVWNKGLHYYPRMPRPLPWTSILFPIQHPNDVDRVPKFMTWNQSEWIIEKNIWIEDAIEQIKQRDPNGKITIVSDIDDPDSDMVHVRPYELSSIDTSKPISFGLFANSGELNWNQRLSWLFGILHDPKYKKLNIVERSWLSSIVASTNPDGQPLYGFGFSFTRNPEHADYWDGSIRDLAARKDRESLGCESCAAKHTCAQYLPTSYVTRGMREYVWPIIDNNCGLASQYLKK